MPKRFTATEKWIDPWFRDLPVEYKAFWLFICDHCDNSGVWKVDLDLADYLLKTRIALDKAINLFGDRITVLKNGYLLINQFISFQYGLLSSDAKPHQQVLSLIEKHRVSKGYPKGIYTLKDKDKEKETLDVKESPREKPSKFVKPTLEECREYAALKQYRWDVERFYDHFETRNWIPKGYTRQMSDWRASMRTWDKNSGFEPKAEKREHIVI